LIPAEVMRTNSAFSHNSGRVRAPASDDPAAQQDEDEDIEAKPFSVETIRRMIASGEIIDLKTVAGLVLLGY